MKTSAIILAATLLVCQSVIPHEAELLAAYIESAASETSLITMCAVGAVIVNRCKAGGSITGEGRALGIMPSPSPSSEARYAASLVMNGLDITDGAVIFFSNENSELYARFEKLITLRSDDLCFARR